MPNKINIVFTNCTPAPDGGFNLYYRPEGSSGAFLFAGNFTGSPISFIVPGNDPLGTKYEGHIAAVVNGQECSPVDFGGEDLIEGTFSVIDFNQDHTNLWSFTLNKPAPCRFDLSPLNYQDSNGSFQSSFCVVQAGVTSGTDSASNTPPGHTISCVHNDANPGSNIFNFTVVCSGVTYRVRMTFTGSVCP